MLLHSQYKLKNKTQVHKRNIKKTRGRNTKADEMMSQHSHTFPSRYSTPLLT